jgi:hypothetical protein
MTGCCTSESVNTFLIDVHETVSNPLRGTLLKVISAIVRAICLAASRQPSAQKQVRACINSAEATLRRSQRPGLGPGGIQASRYHFDPLGSPKR